VEVSRYGLSVHESAGPFDMQRRDGIRAIERAMFEIARSLGRRDLGRQIERRLGKLVDGSHLLVVDAIDEGTEQGEPPTVGKVAKFLDVHPSRASRMVKGAIRAGLAVRVASQGDGRKSCLELSPRGREIVRAIRGARARYFAARMKGWPRVDRREFGRLLVQFAESDHPHRHERADNDNVTPPMRDEPETDLSPSPATAASKRRASRATKRNRSA
jgi:DNA-binding MarR family transcriptional regulator